MIRCVETATGVNNNVFLAKGRKRSIVNARIIFMVNAYELLGATSIYLSEITGFNNSAVFYYKSIVDGLIEYDAEFCTLFRQTIRLFNQKTC